MRATGGRRSRFSASGEMSVMPRPVTSHRLPSALRTDVRPPQMPGRPARPSWASNSVWWMRRPGSAFQRASSSRRTHAMPYAAPNHIPVTILDERRHRPAFVIGWAHGVQTPIAIAPQRFLRGDPDRAVTALEESIGRADAETLRRCEPFDR